MHACMHARLPRLAGALPPEPRLVCMHACMQPTAICGRARPPRTPSSWPPASRRTTRATSAARARSSCAASSSAAVHTRVSRRRTWRCASASSRRRGTSARPSLAPLCRLLSVTVSYRVWHRYAALLARRGFLTEPLTEHATAKLKLTTRLLELQARMADTARTYGWHHPHICLTPPAHIPYA